MTPKTKHRPRTPEEKRRDTDKRLLAKFGIPLVEREERIRRQNNKCKVCGGPLDAYGPPSIDHFHFYVQISRLTEGDKVTDPGAKWRGQVFDERGNVVLVRDSRTKLGARVSAKKAAMPWSIRAILCFKCNRGLGGIEKFFNAARHPENLLPVIEYFQARLNKCLTP